MPSPMPQPEPRLPSREVDLQPSLGQQIAADQEIEGFPQFKLKGFGVDGDAGPWDVHANGELAADLVWESGPDDRLHFNDFRTKVFCDRGVDDAQVRTSIDLRDHFTRLGIDRDRAYANTYARAELLDVLRCLAPLNFNPPVISLRHDIPPAGDREASAATTAASTILNRSPAGA